MKEYLLVSSYEQHTMQPSQVIPGVQVAGPTYFFCPRCKTRREELHHGVETWCKGCGLIMTAYGNRLVIEGDKFREG